MNFLLEKKKPEYSNAQPNTLLSALGSLRRKEVNRMSVNSNVVIFLLVSHGMGE